jgi:hypothetical protein
MGKVVLDKQLLITVDNKVGTLAEISKVISSSGINLIAVCAYAVDNKGVIMFVSEDNKTAKKLLKEKGYDVREEEVILLTVDNKPGSLQAVTEKIAAAGIDLTLIYGSVEQKGKTSRIVLISEDNNAVLTAIKIT